jgi:hypothetical protein
MNKKHLRDGNEFSVYSKPLSDKTVDQETNKERNFLSNFFLIKKVVWCISPPKFAASGETKNTFLFFHQTEINSSNKRNKRQRCNCWLSQGKPYLNIESFLVIKMLTLSNVEKE